MRGIFMYDLDKPLQQTARDSFWRSLQGLDKMVEDYCRLPPQAMNSAVTHSDMHSVLLLVKSLMLSVAVILDERDVNDRLGAFPVPPAHPESPFEESPRS